MTRLIHFFLAMLACIATAQAQTDPPGRVGRLSHIENGVEFRVDRNDQGSPTTVNWPISNGAILSSGRDGRAEVWIGSTAYRLAENSEIEFAAVDDNQVAIRINGGTLAVSILDRDQADDVTILTPGGRIRFATPGRYRIEVGDRRSELSVQAGQAIVDDGSRGTPVNAGEQARLAGDRPPSIDRDGRPDNFDRWVAERENASLASTTRRHVSPYMTGYQDLDAYGDWQSVPDYGTVWYPNGLADDWAPYRYGRWAWIAPWGWTWIDQAPWGFAPFHYGRWAIIHGRWGWIPGSHASRPVYAPALVAWHGDPGWRVGFSFGTAPAVGWFPLGPREVYVPSYRHSPQHVRQLNITHIHDVTIIDRARRPDAHRNFAYRDQPRAVTVIPAEQLREGRPITAQSVRRNQRAELERAPQAGTAPRGEWLKPAPEARRPRPDFDPARREERFPPRAAPAPRGEPGAETNRVFARPREMETPRDNAPPHNSAPAEARNPEPAPRPDAQQREWRRDFPARPAPQRTEPESPRPAPGLAPRVGETAPMRNDAGAHPPEIRPEMPQQAPQREMRRDEPPRQMTPRIPEPEIRREAAPPPPRPIESSPPRAEPPFRPSEPRPEMPQREMRRDEPPRQMAPRMPEQEIRREVREMPRIERPAPQEREAPAMRQREMPRNEPRPPEVRNEARGDRQRQERRDNREQH